MSEQEVQSYKRSPWTAEDDATLMTMIHDGASMAEQAKALGRTVGAVQVHTSKLRQIRGDLGGRAYTHKNYGFYMFFTMDRQFLIFGQSTNPKQRIKQYTYANTCEEIVFLTKEKDALGTNAETLAKAFWANLLDDKYRRGYECYAVGHLSQSELEKSLKDFEAFLGHIDIINDMRVFPNKGTPIPP